MLLYSFKYTQSGRTSQLRELEEFSENQRLGAVQEHIK
jgi:hypothetical protein